MNGQRKHLIEEASLITRGEALAKDSAVPAVAGVYAWWFDEIPPGVPSAGCERRNDWVLLYVGISPKAPPRNGKPPSKQTLLSRVRYHFGGNAEGSTLRLTLGVLLSETLGIELRRVGSGKRHTFSVGEERLSQWMEDHARVTFVEYPEPWLLEEMLIEHLDVPLNLDQNTRNAFHAELTARRKAAKVSAAGRPVLPK